MSLRREYGLIALLWLIMLLKGTLWAIALPLWQGPDEDDHYAVIQFIAETGRLPDEGDELLPDEVDLSRQLADVGRLAYAPEQRQSFSETELGPNEQAFQQLPSSTRSSFERQAVGKLMHATPLYYYLSSFVYRAFYQADFLSRVYIQRMLNNLISSPIVIVAYLICQLLFPNNQPLRLTIPALVTFHPMLTEITAVVSVDGLFFLCYSLLIYFGLLILKKGLTRPLAIGIGISFIIGVLTKPTLNGYAPLVALLVAYDWWFNPNRRWPIFKNAVLMNLIIIPPLLWWMQRSYRLNNDLFYFNPILKGHRILTQPFYGYSFFQHTIDFYQSIWGGLFTTWWAHFGWLDTAFPPFVYTFLRILTWLAIFGLIYRLTQWSKRPLSIRKWTSSQPPLIVWLFLALVLLVPIWLMQFYDLSFWWEYGNGRGLQGRYWLGTIIPMLLLFTVGLLAWIPPKYHPITHHTLRLSMILFNFVSLIGYILPRYYL